MHRGCKTSYPNSTLITGKYCLGCYFGSASPASYPTTNMCLRIFTCLLLCVSCALTLAGCGGGSANSPVAPPVLLSLATTQANPSIPLGTNQQFTATGTFNDGSTQDLTSSATWSSSSAAVATISNTPGSQGLATSIGLGATIITATSSSISSSTTLTVTPAVLLSLALMPANPSIFLGSYQQFIVIGTFSDGTAQNLTTLTTWSSSSTRVANMSNASGSQGLATSAGTGTTTVRATSAGVTGSTTLTVNAVVGVSVSPSSLGFGNQLLNTTSSHQTVTLMNSSSTPLQILSVVASGDFAQTNTCGNVLAAGASCTIAI